MNRYFFALDIHDDPALIAEYEEIHRQVWPEILESIADAGITQMQIWRAGNRLVMLMETDDTFSFERKDALDAANPVVHRWEALMWKYQKAIPVAKENEKWVLMSKIFDLQESMV
ncbi:L-fucose mutarotase [Ravibacter arvi]|uniref:L-fucose mutarotase n=1 Tax=Ravibacter arvi TaxID=2051041 RepID=A0ABP8LJL6_9BACT